MDIRRLGQPGRREALTQRPGNGSFFGQGADARKTKTTERVLEKMRAWGYSLRGPRGEEGRLAYVRITKEEDDRYIIAMESLRKAIAQGVENASAWAEIEESAQAHYNAAITNRLALPWRPPY